MLYLITIGAKRREFLFTNILNDLIRKPNANISGATGSEWPKIQQHIVPILNWGLSKKNVKNDRDLIGQKFMK